MRSRNFVAITMALSLCVKARTASVENDLEKDTRLEGLALVAVVGQGTAVFPFGQPAKYYATKWGVAIPTFAKSGRVIAWNIRTLFREPAVVIETVKGEQSTKKAFWLDLSLLSLNEICGRIALLARSGQKYPGAFDLRWTSTDFSMDEFIDRMPGQESHGADWSPDCRFLVYGKADEIRLFDTKAKISVQIGRGYDPAWSPEGKTIAFRGLVGTVSLMNAKGQVLPSPLESHLSLATIRWSPNGRYVSFIEKISHVRLGFSAPRRDWLYAEFRTAIASR